jgi:hypothetical protein
LKKRRLDTRRQYFLNHTSNTSQLNFNTFSCAARAYTWLVRLLLLLTAVSLITAPVTQLIWTWDHFLRGGLDFEFGALAILTTLLLVLLLARHGKQCAGLLLAAGRLFALARACRGVAETARHGILPASRRGREQVSRAVLGIDNLPLQI